VSLFNNIRHLLPRGRAWRVTIDKSLRRFFEGLGEFFSDIVEFLDLVWLDLFPASTRELDAWEAQFGLQGADLTEQERRDRLAGTWQAVGGQSISYLQGVLQGRGFNVYFHDWWEPGTEPAIGSTAAAEPRNPLLWLERGDPAFTSGVEAGEPRAQAGEAFAQAGNVAIRPGYALVNKLLESAPRYLVAAGEPLAQAGEPTALAGNYANVEEQLKKYIVPVNSIFWPYFLYISAETFGDPATISADRRDEFESLCLQICPTQLWIGVIVEYT
jgi:hypothetical protein